MFTFLFGLGGLILSAASTAYGIVSQVQAANAAAEQQRRNAEAQSASLRQQAEQEEQNQLQRSMLERRQNARRIAAAQTGYAAGGVTLAGTPTLSLARMTEERELETAIGEAASGQKRQLLLTDAHNVLTLGYANASATKSSGITSAVGMGLSGAAGIARGAWELSSYEDKKSDNSKNKKGL